MDWENERYVRLYVRDSLTWTVWRWETRAVFMALLRKVDRAGVLDIGPHEPVEAVAAVIGFPVEVVEPAIGQLLGCGTLERGDGVLVMPNYLEAQEAKQSDAQRQRESRARRLAKARAKTVTKRDEGSEGSEDPTGAEPESSRPERSRKAKSVTKRDEPPGQSSRKSSQNVTNDRDSVSPQPSLAEPAEEFGQASPPAAADSGRGLTVAKAARTLWDRYEKTRATRLSTDRRKPLRGYTSRRRSEVERFVKHVQADLGADIDTACEEAWAYLQQLIDEAAADASKVKWTTHRNVFTSAAWDRYRGRQLAGIGTNGVPQRPVVDGLPLFVDEQRVYERDGLEALREYRQRQRETGTSPHT